MGVLTYRQLIVSGKMSLLAVASTEKMTARMLADSHTINSLIKTVAGNPQALKKLVHDAFDDLCILNPKYSHPQEYELIAVFYILYYRDRENCLLFAQRALEQPRRNYTALHRFIIWRLSQNEDTKWVVDRHLESIGKFRHSVAFCIKDYDPEKHGNGEWIKGWVANLQKQDEDETWVVFTKGLNVEGEGYRLGNRPVALLPAMSDFSQAGESKLASELAFDIQQKYEKWMNQKADRYEAIQ